MTATTPTGSAPTITGRWRIVEMELWNTETIDLVGPAFIEFAPDRSGSFEFVAVTGWMDVRPTAEEEQGGGSSAGRATTRGPDERSRLGDPRR